MKRKIAFTVAGLCAVCLLAAAGSLAWLALRPQPKALQQTLFSGINYQRAVVQDPRPIVLHIVKVDLRAEGISLLVTPGDPKSDLPLKASTTADFLKKYGLQLAINGDGFSPWHTNSLLDYYPHSGDSVAPIGFAASRGTIYSNFTDAEPVLYISRTNQARFNTPTGKIYNAISGNHMLVEQGQNIITANTDLSAEESNPQPRTAIGLDRNGKHLIIIVADGRQPGYSEGATLPEMADYLILQGAYFGMNLDGGGSTTLVKQGKLGASVLNSPIDQHIPGRQRPVGNHLGIFAKANTSP